MNVKNFEFEKLKKIINKARKNNESVYMDSSIILGIQDVSCKDCINFINKCKLDPETVQIEAYNKLDEVFKRQDLKFVQNGDLGAEECPFFEFKKKK